MKGGWGSRLPSIQCRKGIPIGKSLTSAYGMEHLKPQYLSKRSGQGLNSGESNVGEGIVGDAE